jgi:hypothetical protein
MMILQQGQLIISQTGNNTQIKRLYHLISIAYQITVTGYFSNNSATFLVSFFL